MKATKPEETNKQQSAFRPLEGSLTQVQGFSALSGGSPRPCLAIAFPPATTTDRQGGSPCFLYSIIIILKNKTKKQYIYTYTYICKRKEEFGYPSPIVWGSLRVAHPWPLRVESILSLSFSLLLSFSPSFFNVSLHSSRFAILCD